MQEQEQEQGLEQELERECMKRIKAEAMIFTCGIITLFVLLLVQ